MNFNYKYVFNGYLVNEISNEDKNKFCLIIRELTKPITNAFMAENFQALSEKQAKFIYIQ